jgi:hypothetical protein
MLAELRVVKRNFVNGSGGGRELTKVRVFGDYQATFRLAMGWSGSKIAEANDMSRIARLVDVITPTTALPR